MIRRSAIFFNKVINTTNCFLLKDGKVLLGLKKRGFGMGKWNGFGGKLKEGEDIKIAALREINEEAGVDVTLVDLKEAGTLEFCFQNNSDWDNLCHVFIIAKWLGEPSESEEMRPQWYAIDNLPFGEMWIDDPHWVPLVLAEKKITGRFLFSGDGSSIIDFSVVEI
jgi:8-oxo-dGTP pyrophosphatase MutT (NUDIX family)